MRFPITTGPEGIVRTTWKFTALANVGTRTTQPAITGTPTKVLKHAVGSNRGGGCPHPQRREAHGDRLLAVDSRHAYLFLQSGTAIAAARAIDLDHAFVAIVGKLSPADRNSAAGDLQRRRRLVHPCVRKSIGASLRNGAAYILDPRLRNPQFQRRRGRGWGDIRHAIICTPRLTAEGVDDWLRTLVRPIRITRHDRHAGRVISQVSQTDNPQTSRPTA